MYGYTIMLQYFAFAIEGNGFWIQTKCRQELHKKGTRSQLRVPKILIQIDDEIYCSTKIVIFSDRPKHWCMPVR